MTYQRTCGERNKINKMRWLPAFVGDKAVLKSGRVYDPRPDGWRRLGKMKGTK